MCKAQASDGKLIAGWTQAPGASAILIAMGRDFVADIGRNLYMINPQDGSTIAIRVADNLGGNARGLAFDGSRIWSANLSGGASGGSVSIIIPGGVNWASTTISDGLRAPSGILYDGNNIWITDAAPEAPSLRKLDSNGTVLLSVPVGNDPRRPAFDGTNIWVPNRVSNSITVIRAFTGAVLATLTGNGLNGPQDVAFDGERILVTNETGNRVSLWKAADLSPLGSFVSFR